MSIPRDPDQIPLLPEDWPSSPPPLAHLRDASPLRPTGATGPMGTHQATTPIAPFPVEYASLLPVTTVKPTRQGGLPAWITAASLGLVALFAVGLIVTNLPANSNHQPLPTTGGSRIECPLD